MGAEHIREIIASDWEYWGDVKIHSESANNNIHEEIAWISMTATLLKSEAFNKAMPQYLEQMDIILKEDNADAIQAMMNATFYGLGRLRDSMKKVGDGWALVITAVLVKRETGWKFNTIHWSMPAE